MPEDLFSTDNGNVNFALKMLIGLCSGVFGIAIALSVQHIRIIGLPRCIIFIAICVQLTLSWGVFIFVMIFFKSSLVPDTLPNDDWTALTIAYFASSIPHLMITTALIIYSKEINKFLEKRYGEDIHLPDMNQVQVMPMSKADIRRQLKKRGEMNKPLIKSKEQGEEMLERINNGKQNIEETPHDEIVEEALVEEAPKEHVCNYCGQKIEETTNEYAEAEEKPSEVSKEAEEENGAVAETGNKDIRNEAN